jgi:hypothetical protein
MANCDRTKTENVPLYPGIHVPIPFEHKGMGIKAALRVEKVDKKCVAMFVGMSNFRQETAATLRVVKAAGKRHIVWYNACKGNWDLSMMVNKADEFWTDLKAGMVKRKVTGDQVRVLFIKNSYRGGAKPGQYEEYLNVHIDRAIEELPGVEQVFISSALYSGYSSKLTTRSEPGAYLEGVAVDNVIRSRIGKAGPWVGWGPYLWANGTEERGDDLVWNCLDFELDGIHPGPMAEAKVADMYFRFMANSPVTGWFL